MRFALATCWALVAGIAATNGFASTSIPAEFLDAPAVVLQETRSWSVVPLRHADFEVHERVQILDPRGFDEADRAILYDAKRSKIDFFEARTIQSNGEVIDVSDDLIHDVVLFKSEEVEFHSFQFTFPSVRPGAVLELRYRIHEGKPVAARKWEPQRAIPVLESSFSMEVRQPAHVVPLRIYPVGRGTGGESCEVLDSKRSSRASKYGMVCRNIPALEFDSRAPPERDVRLRLDVIWGPERMVAEQWKYRAGMWSEPINRFVQQCRECKNIATDLAREAKNDAERLDRIFDWTKRNLEFRPPPRFGEGSGPNLHYAAADEVLENHGGWPNEITLLTMALLRASGVQVNPILVADRSEGRFHYDALDSVRHLMLVAAIDGAFVVVDPSCRYCEPGITDWRYAAAEGPAGVRLDDSPGVPVMVGTIPATHNVQRRTERIELADDGTARITGEAIWSGQFSVEQRRRWERLPEVARHEAFLGDLAGDIDNPKVDISDPNDVFQTLTAQYSYESGSMVLPDGRMLIRPLDIFSERLPIPIQEERALPLWFPFPFSVVAEAVIGLPSGYRIELPAEPIRLTGPGMTFRLRWSRGRRVGEVVWRGELMVTEVEVEPERYDEAREFARALRHLLRGGLVAATRQREISGGTP